MKIKFGMRNLEFELQVCNKINVICGESGSGKSLLKECVIAYMDMPNYGHWDCDIPVGVLQGMPGIVTDEALKDDVRHIYIVDEEDEVLHSKKLARALAASKHIFVICSRGLPGKVPYGLDDIYELVDIDGVRTAVKGVSRRK